MARRTIEDRTLEAINKLERITDKSVEGFTTDASKLAAQLLRDSTGDESTGALANSLGTSRKGKMQYAVETDAANEKGHGYGAAQEYGYHPRGTGQKVKGKYFILRGTTGMISRWSRGEKWRD